MKLGAEKKGEVIALVVLLAVAVVMLWRSLMPASTPVPIAAPAAPRAAAAPTAPAAPAAQPSDPTLHLDQLAQLRAIAYSGQGRDLFHFGSAPSPSPAAARPAPSVASAKEGQPPKPLPPSGPPPPPPIPLKFYGFAQAANQPEKIFLQMGEDNFVVTQGETIAHRYLIVNIGKVSVRVKDLQTNSEQELPLQQG